MVLAHDPSDDDSSLGSDQDNPIVRKQTIDVGPLVAKQDECLNELDNFTFSAKLDFIENNLLVSLENQDSSDKSLGDEI